MWPFKKNEPGILKLIIDFRSSSVGGALVVEEPNKDPVIIYSTRSYAFLEKIDNPETFWSKMLMTLDKVLDSVDKEGVKKNAQKFSENFVSEVWCAFSSPWYESKIKNFEINNTKPTKFTKSLLEKILAKNEQTKNKEGDRKEIENKIISVYLNGYEVTDPFEKKADKILVSFYSSEISTKTENEVVKRISEKFGTNNIKICTHPLMIISLIKALFHSVSEFVFVDIGGETTDIGLFRGGKLEDLITIPKGTLHFLRKLIEGRGLDFVTATSHLNLLFNNKLDETTTAKSFASLKIIKDEFISIIKKALENKWLKEVTPATIFLTSDGTMSGLLKDIILTKDFYSGCLKINRDPILQIINKNSARELTKEDSNTREDLLLSLISTYSNIDKN